MPRPLLLTLLALVVACGGADRPAPTARSAAARPSAGPATIAFRVPRTGGAVRAYAWPALDSAIWTSEAVLPATSRVLGFAPSVGRLVLQGTKGSILWLDVRRNALLSAGPALRLPVLVGASGEVAGLDAKGQLVRSSPDGITWRGELPGPISELHALADGSLVALGAGARGPEVWRWTPPDTAAPARAATVRDARLAAGATGGRLWIAAPGRVRGLVTTTLADATMLDGLPMMRPSAVTTTPSGNTVLALYDKAAALEVIDRDRNVRVPAWTLPGAGRDLRMDGLGRLLLVRPAQGESAWAIDVASAQVRSTLSTNWRDDLPVVAPDGTVLVVLGPDVTRLDAVSLQRVETVLGGALDWWHVAVWEGLTARGQDAPPPVFAGVDSVAPDALDSAIAAAAGDSLGGVPVGDSGGGDSIAVTRWLVSFASLVDAARAEALAQQLREGGAPARVMPSTGARGPVYRVVLGPYATRDAAVRAGRATGREHWVLPDTP